MHVLVAAHRLSACPGRTTPGLLGLRPSAQGCHPAHPSPLESRLALPGGDPPGPNCSGARSAPPSGWSGAGVKSVGGMWPTGIVDTGCLKNQSPGEKRRTRRHLPGLVLEVRRRRSRGNGSGRNKRCAPGMAADSRERPLGGPQSLRRQWGQEKGRQTEKRPEKRGDRGGDGGGSARGARVSTGERHDPGDAAA